MRGWLQNRFADFLLAWGDAALFARHGDMASTRGSSEGSRPARRGRPAVVSPLAPGRPDHRLEGRRGLDRQHSASVARSRTGDAVRI